MFRVLAGVVLGAALLLPAGNAAAGDYASMKDAPQERIRQFSAVAGLYVSRNIYDYSSNSGNGDFEENVYGFEADARAMYRVMPRTAAQLEFTHFSHGDTDPGDDSPGRSNVLSGHLIYYTGSGAIGVFGAHSWQRSAEDKDKTRTAFYGAEYAHFMNNMTLFVQGGAVQDISAGDEGDVWGEGGFGNLGMRYFLGRNQKLEANFAFGLGKTIDPDDANDKDDFSWYQLGLEYEHRLESRPFSIVAGYKADYLKVKDNQSSDRESLWAHAFRIGVRMYFGQQSLRELDRNGVNTFKMVDMSAPLVYTDELD
jgi:hypothetical protein